MKQKVEHKKYEVRYEDDEKISIWKYDTKKTKLGPYEVEHIYKNEPLKKNKRKK